MRVCVCVYSAKTLLKSESIFYEECLTYLRSVCQSAESTVEMKKKNKTKHTKHACSYTLAYCVLYQNAYNYKHKKQKEKPGNLLNTLSISI